MKVKTVGRMLLFTLGIIGISILYFENRSQELLSPFVEFNHSTGSLKATPLDKYSFEFLRKRVFTGSQIKIEKEMVKGSNFTSYLYTAKADGKKVSGQINIPDRDGWFPVIIMLRGYADNEIYSTGLGTRKPAEVFVENGYITIAPDFLGFGISDQPSSDILEARFEKPVTVLELLASVKNIKKADPNKIFIWGHSNGGQIALSILEITQRTIPTTLWAPVSKGFPESILTYTGDDENGQRVKNRINSFLSIYDPKKFSIDNYFADIKAPVQLHQGLADPLVKEEWSDNLADILKRGGNTVNYYKYPKSDHNLKQDWDEVVKRDLEFFKKHLK